MEHARRRTSWLDQRLPTVLLALAGLGLGFALITVVAYVWFFGQYLSEDHARWAQFGDFFGGVVGTVLSFLAVVAVLLTLWVQRRELREQLAAADAQLETQRLTALVTGIAALSEAYRGGSIDLLPKRHQELISSLEMHVGALDAVMWPVGANAPEVQEILNRHDDPPVTEPKFILENIAWDSFGGRRTAVMQVRNLGEHFDGHIVKLTSYVRASDGYKHRSQEWLPAAFHTVANPSNDKFSRFELAKNESGRVMLGFYDSSKGIVLPLEGRNLVLVDADPAGYIISVQLFGTTSIEYSLLLKQTNHRFSVVMLTAEELKAIASAWTCLP